MTRGAGLASGPARALSVRRTSVLVLRTVLAVCLIVAAIAKLSSSSPLTGALEEWRVPFGVLEIAIGVGLLGPCVVPALLATLGVGAGGIVIAFARPRASCGCFGNRIALSAYEHVLVSSLLGAVAALSLVLVIRERIGTQRAGAGRQRDSAA